VIETEGAAVKATASNPGKVTRNLLFFSVLLLVLLVSVWVRAAEVRLAWDANSEIDLAGYRIYYGTVSGIFTGSVTVDKAFTTCTITNLMAGQTYYFAATAFDASNIESGYSNEVSCYPSTDTDGDGSIDSQDPDDEDDGMPDAWELRYGLNPLINDAAGDSDGDGISNLAEYAAGSDPTRYQPNHPPSAPSALSPAGNAITILTPALRTNIFADPDAGDTHLETRWVIVQASDGMMVLDVTTRQGLTSLTVPGLLLEENTQYRWRAMFYDNRGAASEWSNETSFATDFSLADMNGNGIPDTQEVDPSSDMDGDGVGDQADSDLKTVHVNQGGTQIAIGTRPSNGRADITAIESSDSDLLHIDVDLDGISDQVPFGLINFKLTLTTAGEEATVMVYFSEPVPPKGRWYKYDPIIQEWLDFSAFAQFSADRLSLTLTIADGGAGDADGVVNGIILDPAGVVVPSSGGGDNLVESVVDGIGGALSSAAGGGCFIGAGANDRARLTDPWGFLGLLPVLLIIGYLFLRQRWWEMPSFLTR
jgi:Bacterial TSP3 repeat